MLARIIGESEPLGKDHEMVLETIDALREVGAAIGVSDEAAKQRIIQRVREGERTRIREEFASKVGDLLSGEIQQIARGKSIQNS